MMPERHWLGRHYLTRHERRQRMARIMDWCVLIALTAVAVGGFVCALLAIRAMH